MADMPTRDATPDQIAGWRAILADHIGWRWCDLCDERAPCRERAYAREQLIAAAAGEVAP